MHAMRNSRAELGLSRSAPGFRRRHRGPTGGERSSVTHEPMTGDESEMLLSVVIPVYDAAKTIERALGSLECLSPESRAVTEIIVADDGSTDDSATRVRAFFDTADFPSVHLLEKPNGGSASARNLGLERATGRFVLFLDADDELATDLVPEIRAAGDASAIVCSARLVRHGRPHGRRVPRRVDGTNHLDRLTEANPFVLSGVVARRERLDAPFDEAFLSLEDWLFWLNNPRVFERPRYRPDVDAAIVHAHALNKSADYVQSGRYRERVARTWLEAHRPALSLKQRNNLRIQAAIGVIQQDGWSAFGTFLRIPCSLRLYGKLWLYAVLRRRLRRFDFYGS